MKWRWDLLWDIIQYAIPSTEILFFDHNWSPLIQAVLTFSMLSYNTALVTWCRCTLHWIFQQPVVIQQCFNFSNLSPVANEYLCSVRIYLHWKQVFFIVLATKVAHSMVKIMTWTPHLTVLCWSFIAPYLLSGQWCKSNWWHLLHLPGIMKKLMLATCPVLIYLDTELHPAMVRLRVRLGTIIVAFYGPLTRYGNTLLTLCWAIMLPSGF